MNVFMMGHQIVKELLTSKQFCRFKNLRVVLIMDCRHSYASPAAVFYCRCPERRQMPRRIYMDTTKMGEKTGFEYMSSRILSFEWQKEVQEIWDSGSSRRPRAIEFQRGIWLQIVMQGIKWDEEPNSLPIILHKNDKVTWILSHTSHNYC